MLILKRLTIEDKAWIDPVVNAEQTESADFCFGNMFVWNEGMNQHVGLCRGRLVIQIRQVDTPFFAFPIGRGPLKPVIEDMREYADAEGLPLIIAGVTEEHRNQMEQEMPGMFTFTAEESYFDYIYETEKLANLGGKKLHGKRNHINKFLNLYPNWRYEAMTPAHFEACRKLLNTWNQEKGQSVSEDSQGEKQAIERAFDNFDILEFIGGVLYVDDQLCAFTLGERCWEKEFLVHFEKADREVEGAYAMINREFVRMIAQNNPEIIWINRGDDMGLESLRQAKRSYKPLKQVVKYTAQYIK